MFWKCFSTFSYDESKELTTIKGDLRGGNCVLKIESTTCLCPSHLSCLYIESNYSFQKMTCGDSFGFKKKKKGDFGGFRSEEDYFCCD